MIISKPDWPKVRVKIGALFQESFGRPMPIGYFDWRYFDNNQDQLLFAVEISDRDLVASYSAFPVDLVSDGNICRTAMSMTTMTHPNWRRKGLFQKLATELYSQMELMQIAAVWGFPNSSSHPTFNGKLCWSDIYEIPTMTFNPMKSDSGKFSLSSEVQRDDEFLLNYPDLPNDGLIRVSRSKSYLSWRYARNPANIYQNFVISQAGMVSSYIVTKQYGDGIDLVDIQPDNPQEAHILLAHIVKHCFDIGARYLCCWAPIHHSLHGVLERLGFQNSSPVTYFGGRRFVSSAALSGWSNYENWYIQMGDSDVY